MFGLFRTLEAYLCTALLTLDLYNSFKSQPGRLLKLDF